MNVTVSTATDFDAWIELAGQVENLFGPMTGEFAFREALRIAIQKDLAFVIREGETLAGGIIISKDTNEIMWLAVSGESRRKGYGRILLDFAINRLDPDRDILVQTFDEKVPEGAPARKLYTNAGFTDHSKAGLNPAGIPTVIMKRNKTFEDRI